MKLVILALAIKPWAVLLPPTTSKSFRQSVDPESDESEFRVLVDNKFVKYITIYGGLFMCDEMCASPPTRLPGITSTWHPTQINHLELHMGRKLRSNTVIAKFARFPWEVPQLERETAAYEWIEGHQIGPAFLGHLTEEGRVIGFIMTNIADGNCRHATPEDYPLCHLALSKLHQLGISHGDINKHNFLIHTGGKAVTLIDFDRASRTATPKELEDELNDLQHQLEDTSGRGGRIVELPEDEPHDL
ncbi:alpha-galactosidase A precursor [Diplogelasinospora grovesii]|uniref:Alpha-galactosidase A n=1 Tax=Diplogelasinospora grovesii TaxID=303347 RepID=A0AAN6NF14_9PEZI|nr:alpha-galactosidase A precursor [Diplogelasinospora grovesii]